MNVTRRGFFGFLAALPFVPKVLASDSAHLLPPPSTLFSGAAPKGWTFTPFIAGKPITAADLNSQFNEIMKRLGEARHV